MISAPAAAAAPQNDVPQPRFDGMWGESGTIILLYFHTTPCHG